MTSVSPLTGGTVGLWCDPAALAQDERVKDVTFPDGITWTDIVASTSERLFLLSGQRWMGAQTIVTRPHRLTPDCGCALTLALPQWGAGDVGSWWNRLFPESGLSLALLDEYEIPGGNVISIDEILVDGMPLANDGTDWLLYGNRVLVRADDENGGRRYWPCCQRIGSPTTAAGTWQLTYRQGAMPPISGRMAAWAWSMERGRRFDTRKKGLPERTSHASSQGLEVTIEDNGALASGGVGIPEVDEFLESVNPHTVTRRAQVYDPDAVVAAIVDRRQ